jgi:hypothetical protein
MSGLARASRVIEVSQVCILSSNCLDCVWFLCVAYVLLSCLCYLIVVVELVVFGLFHLPCVDWFVC